MAEKLLLDNPEVQVAEPEQGPEKPVLNENDRAKLDGIVAQMVKNKESDANIQFVVTDFKKKYAKAAGVVDAQTPATPSYQPPPLAKESTNLFRPNVGNVTPTGTLDTQIAKKHAAAQNILHTELTNNNDLIPGLIKSHKERAASIERGIALDQQPRSDQPLTPVQRIANTLQPKEAPIAVNDEDVNGFLHDLQNNTSTQREFLQHVAQVKPEKTPQIKEALYINDAMSRLQQDPNGKLKEEKVYKNAQQIAKGDLDYNMQQGVLIKPENIGESLATGIKQKTKAFADYDLFNKATPEQAIQELEKRRSEHDPDEPIRVPDGFLAGLTSGLASQPFLGMAAGKVAGTATALIPGAEEFAPAADKFVSAAISSNDFRKMSYSNSLQQNYNQLRNEGMAPGEAYTKANGQAKDESMVDAVAGAAMMYGAGAIGEIPLPKLNLSQGYKTAVINGLKQGVKGIGEAGAVGLIQGEAQQIKNDLAEDKGIQRSGSGEDIKEAIKNGILFTGGIVAIAKGGEVLSNISRSRILQGISKATPEQIDAELGNQILSQHITPTEAVDAKKTIQEHQELDAQIPDKVKNPEVRIDIQQKISKRAELEEELKNLNKAFHPEVKEKIKKIDEDIVELSNSKEAKQESDQPSIQEDISSPKTSANEKAQGNAETEKVGTEQTGGAPIINDDTVRTPPVSYEDFRSHAMEMAQNMKNSEFDWRITIPELSQAAREGAIKDIQAGKDTKRAQQFEQAIREMHDKGVISINRGRGNQAQTVDVPIKDWFSLEPSEQKAVDNIDDHIVHAINENGITLDNIDSFKHLFNDEKFPYNREDFERVKQYLSEQGEHNAPTEKAGESSDQLENIPEVSGKSDRTAPEPRADSDDLKNAQKEYDKAIRVLKSAEDKITKEQAKQSDLFGDGTQSEMFKATREETRTLLDPLRQKVKETKANLEDVQRTHSLAEDKQQELFTSKTEDNARTIRSDKGQISETGDAVERRKKTRGNDIQPSEKPTSINGETKQQEKRPIKSVSALKEEIKKNTLTEEEKFILKNSFPEYKKQHPEATQDSYNIERNNAYKRQVELRKASLDKIQDSSIDVQGKEHTSKQYLDKATAVLKQLFPDYKLIAHPTEEQYLKQEKRPEGSLGVFHPTTKTIALNMERIRKAGAENTIFHEVIHPIVQEALDAKSGAIDAAYSKLMSIRNEKGMESVWRHEDLYRERGLGTVKVEAITEFLTQVADGKIDPSKLSANLSTKIVDVINRILKALGVNKTFSTAADLRKLADAVKKSFDEADASAVKETLGHPKEGIAKTESFDKLEEGSEEERQLKRILTRTELPHNEVKEALLDAGYDREMVDKLMKQVKEEQDLGPEELIKQALNVGKQTREQAKIAPQQETAIAKASLKKTLGRWFGDKQDEVTDVKSIIRKNKGQEEFEIDKIYKATNKLRDFWNTVPKEKQLSFILGMERPDMLKNQSRDIQDMAKDYKKRLDNVYNVIQSALPNINYFEDYFPHFWDKPEEVKNYFANTIAKNPLEGSKSFAKQRFFDTIVEGLKKGYDLTTTNPEELVRLAEANAWKFKTARNIFDDMNKMGYLKFSTAKDLPADWKGIDDKLFNRMGAYVTKDGEANIAKGQYMMPPEVAKLMNNYLSLGIKSPIKNVVQKFNNIKNLFQLGVGMFHFTTTSVESLINGVTTGIQKMSTLKPSNIVRGVGDIASSATILPNLYQNIKRGLKTIDDYHKGNITADVQNLINVNAKVGRQKMYSLDTWYNTKKAFGQLRANKDFSKLPKVFWNGLLTLPEAINKPLMEHWVPALKVAGYLRSLESEIRSRGQMDSRELQQAKEKIWDSMDDRLGQVVYDNVFVNKAAKDLAFMAIRSAGWSGGTIRTAAKGIGELPLSLKRAWRRQGFTQRTADIISMPLTVGFFGAMYQYMMTGNGPDELKDYFFPKDGTTNPDGTEHRVTLPSYIKDYLAYSKHPGQTLIHKTSPLLNDIVELYQNKDFYGEKVYNEDDPIFQKGLDILKHQAETMKPFSFRENPNAVPKEAFSRQWTEQKFGIMDAPKERERTDTQNAIIQAYGQQLGQNANGKTHAEMEKQIARRHLREYIYGGGTWADADPDLKEKAQVVRTGEFVSQSKINPYERYFKNLKKEKRQEIFDNMTEEEQEIYKKYLPHDNKEND